MSAGSPLPLRALAKLDRALGQRSYGVDREQPRTVLSAREHETIDLPPGVVTPQGRLDLYPDVLKHFQVRFKNGASVLQMDRYVGYIPLNDRFAAEVSPRVPIGNLERLVGLAAGYEPKVLPSHLRAFSYTAERPASLLDLLATRMVAAFERVWDGGLLSTYERRERIGSSPIGKIRPFESAWRTAKAGRPVSVSSAFHRTHDFGPNRILRLAFERLLQQTLTLPATSPRTARNAQMRRALDRLEGIRRPTTGEMSTQAVATYLDRLPQHHEHYADALMLAQLVLAGAGLAIRAHGNLAVLPTILIDMEDVFERYARWLLSVEIPDAGLGEVRDGNVAGEHGAKEMMFATAASEMNSPMKPDIVVVRDGGTRLVIDAKYKPLEKAPDRQDLNQVIAYGARYGSPRVMLLYASRKRTEPSTQALGTVGSMEVLVGRMDLGSADIQAEEHAFAAAVKALL